MLMVSVKVLSWTWKTNCGPLRPGSISNHRLVVLCLSGGPPYWSTSIHIPFIGQSSNLEHPSIEQKIIHQERLQISWIPGHCRAYTDLFLWTHFNPGCVDAHPFSRDDYTPSLLAKQTFQMVPCFLWSSSRLPPGSDGPLFHLFLHLVRPFYLNFSGYGWDFLNWFFLFVSIISFNPDL